MRRTRKIISVFWMGNVNCEIIIKRVDLFVVLYEYSIEGFFFEEGEEARVSVLFYLDFDFYPLSFIGLVFY